MGVTVMIIMGLLSVLAISSIDFDQFDELKARLEEEQAQQDEDQEPLDTSELGWLDVLEDETSPDSVNPDLFSFLGNEPTASALDTDAFSGMSEDGAEDDDLFDSFDDREEDESEPSMIDAANDLWPLEGQSEEEDEAEAEEEEAEERIELAGFDAAEDALELPYSQKLDEDGNEIPPEVSVSHNDGWTDVAVDGETHSFVHTADSTFTGLKPEDVQLRAA